ncbi:MAG: Asp-tRNA(Asn)/Glu-tRNA(Gln) amidotransferase subunit GatA [Clostridia bacterium]|jgi:aspartyl-tRNA(Asn)/glutamyl-tRNA(Gln) amidotransferase subunit A|nr:Asp-tRNA(Asn)/Glu-tRNA(Gln) amidotransferase subunit GatA [Clostridia bacterium]
MDLSKLSALEAGRMIKNKEISVAEITKAALENIEKTDKNYHAFITLCADEALKRAEEVQKGIDDGTYTSPLAGVPMALKDNMCTKGILTTCASKILTGFKPFYNATAYSNLENAGAVLLGKLNMDEFAMGSTTETSYYGATLNPWGENRVPGGSSGGSAVAIATDQVYYALGSDTGGSIRQPCAFCGITGIKPTYGRVSRYGLIPYASSLDQIGPMGRSVEDVAAVLNIISGHDPKDSTSVNMDALNITLKNDVKGKKIGIPTDWFGEGLEKDVKEKVLEAAKKLENMGAIIEEFKMPEIEYVIPTYYIIACAEASSNLSRFDGVKYGYCTPSFDDLTDLYCKSRSEGFGMEVKRRIMIGAFVLSSGYYDAYYKKALQVKAVIKKAFDKAFEKYDAILSPTAPTTALKMGENLSDPLKMYLGDIYTVSINLAGLPSMVIPCGFDKEGLPVGLQLTGKPFSENELMNIAYSFQKETDFHLKKPVIKREV